jgi:hypothetical protein
MGCWYYILAVWQYKAHASEYDSNQNVFSAKYQYLLTPSGWSFFVTCYFTLSFSSFKISNAQFGHTHCNPHGICGEKSGFGTGFSHIHSSTIDVI